MNNVLSLSSESCKSVAALLISETSEICESPVVQYAWVSVLVITTLSTVILVKNKCCQKRNYHHQKIDIENIDQKDPITGRTALHKAVLQKNAQLVEKLLKAKANTEIADVDGCTALNDACVVGSLKIIKILKEYGANINSQCNSQVTPLLGAVLHEKINDLTILLSFPNIDINLSGLIQLTPLHAAAYKNNNVFIKQLIENGADVRRVDENDCTPLHYLCYKKDKDVDIKTVKLFKKFGANINARNKADTTPLMIAIGMKGNNIQESLVDELLKFPNILTNIQDMDGNTALHFAVSKRNIPIVKKLVENGASFRIPDDNGETPLMWASKNYGILQRRKLNELIELEKVQRAKDAAIDDEKLKDQTNDELVGFGKMEFI